MVSFLVSITGHITDHMFDRYNITSEDDKGEALLQIDKYLNTEKSRKGRKVIKISDRDRY